MTAVSDPVAAFVDLGWIRWAQVKVAGRRTALGRTQPRRAARIAFALARAGFGSSLFARQLSTPTPLSASAVPVQTQRECAEQAQAGFRDRGRARIVILRSRHSWKRGPEGAFEPWMLAWQVMQPRAIRRSSGCVPVASDCGVCRSFGMAHAAVALLAQERNRRDQQRVLVRTVRRVAIEAAFADRRVLEQEWPALLGMALRAGLVDRIGLQQRAGQRAMRIVAIDAAHLALPAAACASGD